MKPTVVSIRPLTGEAEARFCAEFLAASDPWLTLGMTAEQARARLTNPAREVYVATVAEALIGVMVFDLTGVLNGYLQILAVHPEWRGRGVGAQMLVWAEERIFRQSPNVFLCVSSFNERAQEFYQRLGYQRVGALPDFLKAGLAEILLRKTRGRGWHSSQVGEGKLAERGFVRYFTRVTFLPIVERELRVAARRPMTFWLRIIAALTAFAIASGLLTLFLNIPGGIGAQPGGPLFAVLTWMSLAVALAAGLFFTSDALSEEKREGTLGFLFLTDLRGYDVVLGKLLATSCRCVFALLAVFPVLAGTQLLGGVEGVQFWRTILALLHTLFFSLAAGIFISSISRHPQKALAGTVALLFILVAGGAAVDGLLAYTGGRSFRPMLSLISPITVFLNANIGLAMFWQAFWISEAVAWALLAAACFLITRTWQEKAARVESSQSAWRRWWRFGGRRRQVQLRTVVLEQNPVKWLACRERWQSLLLWAVALVVFGWLGATSLMDNQLFWNAAGWWTISTLATLVLYLWTASQASQVFAEMRRAGLIELLLAAPMDFRKVAPGAWWGLVRLFGAPIAVVLLMQFLAAVTGVAGANAGGIVRMGVGGVIPEWVMLWLGAGAGLLMSLGNFMALIWFGLWMGLTSRNSLLATLKTIAFVQLIPWLVIWFSGMMAFPILIAVTGGFSGGPATSGWFEWYPLVSTGLILMLTLAKDGFFLVIARQKLVQNFRTTATQAIVPVVYRRIVPPVAVVAKIPPVLPPQGRG